MANIAATDVAVTVLNERLMNDGRRMINAKLVFGDGALTYGAGGVPLTIGKFGTPNALESLNVYGAGTSAYRWTYNPATGKLVAMQAPNQTHTHNFKVIGGQAAASTDAVSAKTLTLGKEAATDITIVGANSATLGGVVSSTLAAAGMVEPSTVAIAAQTLYVEVIGW